MHTPYSRILTLVLVLGCVLARGEAQTTATTTTPTDIPPGTAAPPADGAANITPILPIKAQRPSYMIKKKGKELEMKLSYTHSSRNTVFIDGIAVYPVLVIGQVGVEHARKDTLIAALTGRYGVANNLLAEVKVPFRYESDRFSVPDVTPAQERTVTNSGLGDIEGAFYYQFPRRKEEDIRWVVSLGAKSATGQNPFEIDPNNSVPLGSGFWNTKIGLTGVKIVNPVAVFWNAAYIINWENHDVPITVTDPESGEESTVLVDLKAANQYELGAGFAYAINSRFSLNTSFIMDISGSAQTNGVKVANSAFTTASLRLGAVWLTENKRPVDLGLCIGLTEDSPDFTLEYRWSFKF